jgi:hypothetical protein
MGIEAVFSCDLQEKVKRRRNRGAFLRIFAEHLEAWNQQKNPDHGFGL